MFYFQNLIPVEIQGMILESEIIEQKTENYKNHDILPIQPKDSIDRIDSEEFENSIECENLNEEFGYSFLPKLTLKKFKKNHLKILRKDKNDKVNFGVY